MNLRTPFGEGTLRRQPIRRKRGRLTASETRALRTLVYAALVLASCILAITLGWDKAMVWLGVLPVEESDVAYVMPAKHTDLTRRPDILFQVFGTRQQPRMIPVAVLADGKLRHIQLDAAGWRRFDEMFLREGREYTLFSDGRAFGSARLKRGMWETDSLPLYRLEGCASHLPLSEVSIVSERKQRGFIIEMLATNAALPQVERDVPAADRKSMPSVDRVLPAGEERGFVREGILKALDGRAITLATGVTPWPTLITSWIDSASSLAEDPTAQSRHIFLVADRGPDGEYHVTYRHQTEQTLGEAEFRRFVDHLDVTGDGVEELILEGWRFGGKTWISVLSYRGGAWEEIFRSRANWCLDPQPRKRIARRGGVLSYNADREPVPNR